MSTQRHDTTFGPLPHIAAGVLDVGYVEAGPAPFPAPLFGEEGSLCR